MDIVYDPAKDAINTEKHSVSLSLASQLNWDMALEDRDNRRNYGEVWIVAYAPIGDRVFCVVFTDRGDERRIISLRKANAREVDRYEREI